MDHVRALADDLGLNDVGFPNESRYEAGCGW